MLLLHASFEPDALLLWGEQTITAGIRRAVRPPKRRPKNPRPAQHPFAADARALDSALAAANLKRIKRQTEDRVAWLPSSAGAPLASSGLIAESPDSGARTELAPWTVAAHRLGVAEAVELLCACVSRDTLAPAIAIGRDLAFAVLILRAAGSAVARQRFLPDLEEHDRAFRAVWRPVLDGPDAERLAKLAAAMPEVCRALHRKADAPPDAPRRALVTSFLGTVVDHLVRNAALTEAPALRGRSTGRSRKHLSDEGAARPSRKLQRGAAPAFDSPHDAWLHALRSADGALSGSTPAELSRLAAQVREWQRPVETREAAPFRLTFRLEDPEANQGDAWFVRYLFQATHDPSLLVDAEQAWKPRPPRLLARAGFNAREHLLASLGHAARIDASIEHSLRAQAPSGHALDANEAFDFLSERSAGLEQAGFGVLLPAWWTRKGTKGRLTAKAMVKSPKLQASGGLSLDELVRFEWQVALGDEPLSLAELHALAKLKVPLVRIRGQWVHVSAEEIRAALEFWKKKGGDPVTAREVVRMALGAASPPGGFEFEGVEASGWMGELLSRLEHHAGFEELPPPEGFAGTLRPYQLRGYSWLSFLGQCGFGACLADDMGLGKTVQTLAHIQRLWHAGERRAALLVCPTSVVGNWEKEAARFTPALPVMVHHGLGRKKGDALRRETDQHALVISSYALLHRDLDALKDIPWSGLILDEAQNVKNAETKQSRAARAVASGYRLALTGTPVENNVGDLWSLMEFLNPGFLGTQSSFKRTFFMPIQAGHDADAMQRLQRLTGPFVLRRLKTDKTIIADLPEKIEMKVFCTLTREQASLYQAVVSEAEAALKNAEGITRKGLVLATLSKLKQVCNHPAQFLGDNSAIGERSGKLARLTEMIEEIIAVGERTLVFSQFAEMGAILKRHLEETFGREALFLHGGVAKQARDRMVERFQEETDGPGVFILSLKAGGTGLNLTRANHVFHFDRWWNPAVENQATDRAFRIGQARRVQVHKFVCAGTLEEKIDEMIESKKSLAEKIVGTGEGWLTELSTADLRKLMALRSVAVAE